MTLYDLESHYVTTTTQPISSTASGIKIYLNTLPANEDGVISFDVFGTNGELGATIEHIRYSGTGTDGTGDFITVTERAVDNTTASTKASGVDVRMLPTAAHHNDLVDEIGSISSFPLTADADLAGFDFLWNTSTDDKLDFSTAGTFKIVMNGASDFEFTDNLLLLTTGSAIDMNGGEMILDADADTSITADTDDQIDFKVGGTDQIYLIDGVLRATTDSDIDLGTSSTRFKVGYFDNIDINHTSTTVDGLHIETNVDSATGQGFHFISNTTGATNPPFILDFEDTTSAFGTSGAVTITDESEENSAIVRIVKTVNVTDGEARSCLSLNQNSVGSNYFSAAGGNWSIKKGPHGGIIYSPGGVGQAPNTTYKARIFSGTRTVAEGTGNEVVTVADIYPVYVMIIALAVSSDDVSHGYGDGTSNVMINWGVDTSSAQSSLTRAIDASAWVGTITTLTNDSFTINFSNADSEDCDYVGICFGTTAEA